MRLCYDIEANGLIDIELTNKGELKTIADTVHCICVQDIDTGEAWSFGPDNLLDACALLSRATVLVGHNIIGYDNRIMDKLLQWRPTEGCRIIDTLIACRLMHPDRTNLPAGLGGHSLRDWGFYLGNNKQDYDGGWEMFSREMMEYCAQDVDTNVTIFKHIEKWVEDNRPLVDFEQEVAQICCMMASNGWGFNLDAAQEYEQSLTLRRAEIEDELRAVFPTIVNQRWSEKTGKRLKDEVIVFNPGSSKQIAERFADKYGWTPDTTDAGNPVVDEETLTTLTYPEATLILEYRDINKKIGMVTDWIRRCVDGTTIHGRTNSQGTATGRASHSQPNLAQVPSDHHCRQLFGPVKDDWVLVGCDLSGIELRCLAHYMFPFDKGAYAEEILNGDIHTANQNAAGLPTRNDAKTFIYALIYGAGDAKIGSIVGGSAKDGKRLKKSFFEAIPALKKLMEAAAFRANKNGSLRLLDGRRVPIRSEHKALNTLLQGCGAVLSKQWLVLAARRLAEQFPGQYMIHGWIHDEVQVSAAPEVAEQVGALLVQAALDAGNDLKFNMPMDAEYGVGKDWSCTH